MSPTPSRPGGQRTYLPDLLHPHQREALPWLDAHPNALLADEAGLGKTVTAIGHIHDLALSSRLPVASAKDVPVLWITDASLVGQTAAEVARFLPWFKVLASTDPPFSSTPRMKAAFPDGFDVLILGYDLAGSRMGWLEQFDYSLVVLDEVMALKGAGRRLKAITSLTHRKGRAAPRVLAMTATPYENHPLELHAALKAANTPNLWPEGTFGTNFCEFKVFRDQWGKRRKTPVGWKDAAAEAAAQEYLSGVMLRRTIDEVGLSLPTRVGERVRWVQLTPAQRSAYDLVAKDADRLAKFHAEQQAGLAVGTNSALIDALVADLESEGDEQAIVFSEYLNMLDLTASRLSAAGMSVARVDGAVRDRARDDAIATFRSGEARVLLGNVVLERGLNLQNARRLYNLGTSWNPAREYQREGRVRRLGSTHGTYECRTYAPDTPLARRNAAALQRKSDSARVVGL